MEFHKRSFILCSIAAAVLIAGSLAYALLWGVPQWSTAFQGVLAPVISAYDGWPVSIGIVACGLVVVGVFSAVSWKQSTVHYLVLSLGVVSVLAFVSLGLPPLLLTEIQQALSLVVVGLCGLLVAGIFLFAIKDRLSRGRRA